MTRKELTPPTISKAIKDDVKRSIDKMARAVAASNKAYPKGIYIPDLRTAYANGYMQAEKDLALTADDIGTIFDLVRKLQVKYTATVGCYEEVLQEFNKLKRYEKATDF